MPVHVVQVISGPAGKRVIMAVTSSTHFDLPPHSWTGEYQVMLSNASRFDRLLRKDDFLDEGIAAVFGLGGEQAELLSPSFQAGKFTPDQVASWLTERRFTPPVDGPNSKKSSRLRPVEEAAGCVGRIDWSSL